MFHEYIDQTQPVSSLIKETKQSFQIEEEKEPVPKVEKNEQQLFSSFIENLKIKSILCFSEIIIYYGGKRKIKTLLCSLSQGARAFYNLKVKEGALFMKNLADICQLELTYNFDIPLIWIKNKLLSGISVNLIDCPQIVQVAEAHRRNKIQLIKARNVRTDSVKAIVDLGFVNNLSI